MSSEALYDKLTLLIHTCDKFSDLWEANILLLNRFWKDRGIDTFLVTDAETDRLFDGVTVVSAGNNLELPQRTAAILPFVNTEYILITLDDYFLMSPVITEKITEVISIMDKESLDYVRMFSSPNSHRRMPESRLYKVELNRNYEVNLYQGIWRKSFVEKTIREPLNAWQYEVSLTGIAREAGAKCALSKGKEFVILDVVRKGKLLHKAARYLEKHNLYHGPRKVIAWKEEIRIFVFSIGKKILPRGIARQLKLLLIKCGYKFYSGESA